MHGRGRVARPPNQRLGADPTQQDAAANAVALHSGSARKLGPMWKRKPLPRLHAEDFVIILKAQLTVVLNDRTIPACVRCGTVGHRTDICPSPEGHKCGLCGLTVPTADGVKAQHERISSCAVCAHAYANSRDCTGKFRQLKVSGPKAKRPKPPPIRLPNQIRSHPTSGANGGALRGTYKTDPKTPSRPAPSVTSAHRKKTAWRLHRPAARTPATSRPPR
ncbi:hypothetical protein HPB50_024387 [Hyalomma asiaticum]|uniref:Uncharacterized protein n=1 Tax=Hyalomma asiaticum TaxID=266040 RepID=A0ACB7SFE2_HYAAI|nr:hypothetical protein HPB50_024387 [Hyalomma asiaticum]